MPDPSFSFYETDDSTEFSPANKIDFGLVQKGIAGSFDGQFIHLWNDKGNQLGSDTAMAPKVMAIGGADDGEEIWAGTAANGNVSMLECRSCAASNAVGDYQTEWTPIGPTQFLTLGQMPANSMRELELRLNVPFDAADLALSNLSLRVFA